jgi:ribosomal protein S18 acetylase RimI-like enzyme
MREIQLLDNPIWHSLRTGHNDLSVGNDLAQRYPADIGPLSGIANQSSEAYESLRELTGPNGALVLFLEEPAHDQPGWTLIRTGTMSQMIFNGELPPIEKPLRPEASMRLLTFDDIDAMVELAELTEPGPFRRRTATLGNFFGVFDSGRLIAMAGQRTRPSGFVEVSAVCTHPEARGRGYAYALIAKVAEDILLQDATPFLHVLADNGSAIRVYERLGFIQRRTLYLGVFKNSG